MTVLEKQYPDLKIDELAACVIEYMNEETTIEDAEKRDLVATSEITTSSAAVDETTIPSLAGDDSSRTYPPVGPQYSQV